MTERSAIILSELFVERMIVQRNSQHSIAVQFAESPVPCCLCANHTPVKHRENDTQVEKLLFEGHFHSVRLRVAHDFEKCHHQVVLTA